MARLPRIVVPGQALHIVQWGNNRQAIFFDDSDYRIYLETLQKALNKYCCAIHAYVLMTNHVHLLMTPESIKGPSCLMQAMGQHYVRYINHIYRRRGTLWEGRFKSALIDSDQYLLTCSRYIELNPIRAGIVAEPGNYPWSSYHHNALGILDCCITSHPIYLALGKSDQQRQQHYRSLLELSMNDEDLNIIREHTRRNSIAGSDEFQQYITRIVKRRVLKHKHGGDRKSDSFKKISSALTP